MWWLPATPASSLYRVHKTFKVLAGIIVGLIGIAALAYAADVLTSKGAVPRGATVGGVAIGGMDRDEAATTLERELGDANTQPVTIRAGELDSRVVPATAGISPNWAATVEGAGQQSWNPITRLRGFFSTYEVPVASDVDKQALEPELDRITAYLQREPRDGAVWLEGGEVRTEEPLDGQHVDRMDLTSALVEGWADPEGVLLDATTSAPAIGEDAVSAAAEGPAAAAISAPLVAHGRDGVDGTIPVERMGEVVTFVPDGTTLRTDVNRERAQGILAEALAATEQPKRNASISYAGGGKTVTPHVDGVKIDWDATLGDLTARIIGDDPKEFEVAYIDEPATFTTLDAEHATFDQVVGEFTTSGYSATSGTNIALTARTVNGAIVAPGDTFSLNGYTGPRGRAQGYVEGGIILNGRADTAVGGGISQFATTLYNAAYFAGMEDVAHTPHSYYISRYPAGREATVYEGAIDLVFRNTSPYPVRIDTSVGGGSVTVRLMGVKTVNVESINGGRWAQTAPQTRSVSGGSCVPSGGAPGFTTSDTRIIRDLAGAEISRETQTTVYDPQPIIRCS